MWKEIIFAISTLIFFVLFGSACGGDQVSYKQLEGEWTSISAKRNGRATQTLENVVFKFSKDQILETNIFGQFETFESEFNSPDLVISGSKLSLINVYSMTGDTLRISSMINNNRYDFDLIKLGR